MQILLSDLDLTVLHWVFTMVYVFAALAGRAIARAPDLSLVTCCAAGLVSSVQDTIYDLTLSDASSSARYSYSMATISSHIASYTMSACVVRASAKKINFAERQDSAPSQ